MPKSIPCRALPTLFALSFAAFGHAAEKMTAAPAVKKAAPAVVNISVFGQEHSRRPQIFDFFQFPVPDGSPVEPSPGTGSGVIIDASEGYVVTNHHVIRNAERIEVRLHDRRSMEAKLIGSDPGTDVALLQIEAEDLSELPLGDSDALEIGDFVVAIGSPFQLDQTVTLGIVSALGRRSINPGRGGYEDFIQTDASINPGNSGGALVDLEGRLIGINTALITPARGNVGIGFAVPSNMAKTVVDQLLEFGEIRRGHLGVEIEDVSPDIAQALDLDEISGALVSRVIEDSPAEAAGIETEDVIVSVDDEPVEDRVDLRNRIGLSRVGETVQIGIVRDGRRIDKEVVIGQVQSTSVAGATSSEKLKGVEFGEISRDHPWFGRVEGVEVRSVEAGSLAWESGLRGGDVVFAVNRRKVRSVDEFVETVREQEDVLDVLMLHVQRGGRRELVVLR